MAEEGLGCGLRDVVFPPPVVCSDYRWCVAKTNAIEGLASGTDRSFSGELVPLARVCVSGCQEGGMNGHIQRSVRGCRVAAEAAVDLLVVRPRQANLQQPGKPEASAEEIQNDLPSPECVTS